MIRNYILCFSFWLLSINIYSQNKIIVKIDTNRVLQDLVTNGQAGNIGITGANSLYINVSDTDSVVGNEGLMTLTGTSSPYTYNSNTPSSTGLTLQQGTNMTIIRSGNTLTFNSSGGGGGGSTPQTISLSGNTVTLSDGGGSFNFSSNTPASGQVLKWNGTSWVADTDLTGGGGGGTTYTAGTGISINGSNVISNTGDLSNTNELISSFTKNGNSLTIVEAGVSRSINISSTTPTSGQVLKWNGSNWAADTDLTGGGGGGGTTQTLSTTGAPGNITISDANTLVLNVDDADASSTNELQTIGVSGGALFNYNNGFAFGNGTTINAGQGLTRSWSNSVNGGQITFSVTNGGITPAMLDRSYLTSESQILIRSGNNLTISSGNTVQISSNTPTSGQVLKWDGTNWIADTDLTTGGGGGGTQTLSTTGAAGNITISGGNTLNLNVNDADASATNEIDVLRVSGPTSGGGRLQNATNGFNQASEVSLVINGATASVSSGNNGNITWTLPDASSTNEIQTISKSGNTVSLNLSGGSFNISSNTPSSGQVLKWNGSNWTADTDNGTSYTAGTGISISGTTISNTGDLSNTNEIQTLSRSGNNITINGGNTVQISSNTPSSGQVLKWDGTSWIADTDLTTGGGGGSTQTLSTTGAAGNITISGGNTLNLNVNDADASSTNELITAFTKSGNAITVTEAGTNRSVNISQTATPASGQVLKWDGTQWNAAADNNTTYAAGSGISISGTTITNTGDLSNTNELVTSFTKSGNAISLVDAGGTKTVNLSQTASPTSGQVLKWDGTQWNASTDNNTTYSAGTGISISGTTISSTVVNTDAQTLSRSGNNITIGGGTGGNSVVIATSGTAAVGKVLKWDGNNWVYGDDIDTNTTYSAGTGISISGTTITNTGDLSNTNEIQTLGTGTNTITLSSGGGSVGLKTVNGETILGSGNITVSSTNIYNTSGTIPISTTRIVTIPSSSSLELGSQTGAYLDLSNETSSAQFGYASGGTLYMSSTGFGLERTATNNTGIVANASGLIIRTAHNTAGSNGQVLTSNGTYATWQTPSLSFDGIISRGAQSFNVANNAPLPLFGSSMTINASTSYTTSTTTWIKGVGTAHYDITLVVRITSPSDFVTLTLLHGDIQVADYSVYNGEAGVDHSFNFVTYNAGPFNTCQIINQSGVNISGTIRSISIKRVL